MNKKEIKILDDLFSKYIHLRDKVCQGCGRSYGKLDAAHCYGRRYRSIRFDPDNVCLLCFTCHQYYDHHETEKFEFFKKQLGERFDLLTVRANTRQKIDVKLIALQLKGLLKEVKPMWRDSIFPKGTIIHIQNDVGYSETFKND